MSKLQKIRAQLFKNLETSPMLKSKRESLLTYYPPDVSVVKLAAQDPSLKPLKLRDVWFDIKRDREIMLEARKKNVLAFGPQAAPAKKEGKKKKRK
ncbi:hypothetical protein HK103_004385 [Boothiomyces macroporosus]|uniref:Uncharacterized protein n=1 Tax=Boothiomyces macroporosus TaxID=261099 RepID=A0AAD5Y5U7_9FUNG|nr:hypothetical protein HK103_004385 [Boothiomyces macroporosus]